MKEEKNKNPLLKWIILAVAVAAAAFYLFFSDNPKVRLADDQLRIYTTFTYVNIDYSEINDLEIEEILVIGSRTSMGADAFFSRSGTFVNYKFGIYDMYSYKNVDKYIVVHHNKGIAVFNLKDEQETVDFYVLFRQNLRRLGVLQGEDEIEA